MHVRSDGADFMHNRWSPIALPDGNRTRRVHSRVELQQFISPGARRKRLGQHLCVTPAVRVLRRAGGSMTSLFSSMTSVRAWARNW